MLMADKDPVLTELEALLQAARSAPPVPSDQLMTSIVDDAGRVQAEMAQFGVQTRMPDPAGAGTPSDLSEAGFFSWLTSVMGGGLGLGGVACAGAVGLWIGLAPPSFLPDPVAYSDLSMTEAEPFDSFDLTELFSEDAQ